MNTIEHAFVSGPGVDLKPYASEIPRTSVIKPLTGQCLIELLPPEEMDGSLFLPDVKHEKTIYGIVRALGPWPKSRSGYGILPEFGIGAKVVCSPWIGQKVRREIGENLKLVRTADILAVVT